jgi:hypothetical protein
MGDVHRAVPSTPKRTALSPRSVAEHGRGGGGCRALALETLARIDPGSLEGEICDALQSLATP